MRRIEIATPFHGILYMIVCCEKDCTEKEILTFCNDENPCGTTRGWCYVLGPNWEKENQRPIQCLDDKRRIHVMVGC
jgi:hypothetical protein